MQTLILVLRLIHLFGGVFWVGTAIFNTFFLGPALATVGPTAGSVMGALERKKLMTALPLSAIATMASGIWLMWIDAAGAPSAFMRSGVGAVFAIGGLCAILAFLLSMVVSRPAFVAVGQLSASLAAATSPTERDQLQAQINALRYRVTVASKWATGLLLGAVACMAVARYL